MRALITGVTGQDGSYLAELLLDKGYEVYGMLRNIRRESHQRLAGVASRIHLVEADLTDQSSLDRMVQLVQPDELYNLAGQTFVPVRSEEHTSELQSQSNLVCRLLLE